MSKRKILILGGKTGLAGQAFAEIFDQAGWEVTCASREDVDFTEPNASDKLAALLDSIEPECLCNAVAYTKVDAAEDEEEQAAFLNKSVPAMIGRLVKNRDIHLVHVSTDFVFDGKKTSPYTEEDETNTLSVYGQTKLDGEKVLLALELPKLTIVRTAWLFGPGGKNFVRTILHFCAEKKAVNVVHDQIGSPTYTLDLALYTLKLIEAGATGIYNVVNAGCASWCELASEAVSLSHFECPVTAVPSSTYPQKAIRPVYSVLDISKLAKAIGMKPRPWPQALREYIFRDFLPDS